MTDFVRSREDDSDAEFVSVVEEITARLLAGEQVSPQALAEDYPQYAAELAHMMSTMSALADWGNSVGPAGSVSAPNGILDAKARHPLPLGDFRPIRKIARGGMGIVYEAEQLSLARRVALNVDGRDAGRQIAQAVPKRSPRRGDAQAPKHRGSSFGCERGVHFYAMDLIDGQSLAETIEKLRQADSSAGSAPDTNGRPGKGSAGSAHVFGSARVSNPAEYSPRRQTLESVAR